MHVEYVGWDPVMSVRGEVVDLGCTHHPSLLDPDVQGRLAQLSVEIHSEEADALDETFGVGVVFAPSPSLHSKHDQWVVVGKEYVQGASFASQGCLCQLPPLLLGEHSLVT